MHAVDIGPARVRKLEDYYSNIARRVREDTHAGGHAALRLDAVKHTMLVLGYHFVERRPDQWSLEHLLAV